MSRPAATATPTNRRLFDMSPALIFLYKNETGFAILVSRLVVSILHLLTHKAAGLLFGPRNACASTAAVTAGAQIGMIVFDKNVARQHGLLWLELAARGEEVALIPLISDFSDMRIKKKAIK